MNKHQCCKHNEPEFCLPGICNKCWKITVFRYNLHLTAKIRHQILNDPTSNGAVIRHDQHRNDCISQPPILNSAVLPKKEKAPTGSSSSYVRSPFPTWSIHTQKILSKEYTPAEKFRRHTLPPDKGNARYYQGRPLNRQLPEHNRSCPKAPSMATMFCFLSWSMIHLINVSFFNIYR